MAGREGKSAKNATFLGKGHDNKILKVQFLWGEVLKGTCPKGALEFYSNFTRIF